MRAFWVGFFKASDSRLAYDAWLTVNGIAIGGHIERQRFGWLAVHVVLLAAWLVLSQRKQVRG